MDPVAERGRRWLARVAARAGTATVLTPAQIALLRRLADAVTDGAPFDAIAARAARDVAELLAGTEVRYLACTAEQPEPCDTCIVAPVLVGDETAGRLLARRPGRALDAAEIEVLHLVASVLGTAAARDRTADAVARLTRVDALTGLASWAGLRHTLEQALGDPGPPLAAILVDLDDFSLVNDGFGPDFGDEVLRTAARRISATVGSRGRVARVGADRFGIVAPACAPDEAHRLAVRVATNLRTPVPVASGPVRTISLTASLGIASGAPGRDCASDVLRDADTALSQAKRQGRGTIRHFDQADRAHVLETRHLVDGLARALREGELVLHYQPVVDLGLARVSGAEALVRWNHPDYGLIGPNGFIPAAEQLGLVGAVGDHVMRLAAHQLAAWRREDVVGADFTVAVNVSASQLATAGYAGQVAATLQDANVPPSRIELEITETALVHDLPHCEQTLRELRDLGVGLAVDDFGVGYSSLAYLHRLPLDTVKIDRSFVERIGNEEGSDAIIEGVIAVARRLGLRVTAEGVESAEQLQALVDLRCDRVQGYRFAPALPAAEFAEWIQRTDLALPAPRERRRHDRRSGRDRAPQQHTRASLPSRSALT